MAVTLPCYDPTPSLDIFLRGYLNDRVYKPTPKPTDELKAAIKREICVIYRNIVTRSTVIFDFKDRPDVVISQN